MLGSVSQLRLISCGKFKCSRPLWNVKKLVALDILRDAFFIAFALIKSTVILGILPLKQQGEYKKGTLGTKR